MKINSKDKLICNKKGITLISLAVIIILLIILASVTINLVINREMINKTENTLNKYTEEEMKKNIELAYMDLQTEKIYNSNFDEEQYLTLKLEEKFGQGNVLVNKNNKIYTVTLSNNLCYILEKDTVIEGWKKNQDGSYSKGSTSGVQVGDIVHYETELAKTANAVDGDKKSSLISDLGTYSGNTDSSQNTDSSVVRDSLTWKVLDVKDGKIRIISTVPTTSKIRIYRENGYNNAVYLLDKACDTLYSIDGIGKAQNLKIEDIEEKIDKTKYDYTQYANSNVEYGGTKEYTSNLQYPNIYSSEVGCKAVATADNTGNTLGLSEQTSPVTEKSTATNRLKVTQTYWYKSMVSTDFTDSKYYTLFINNGSNLATYWMSSRCVSCDSSHARFGVRRVDGGNVNDCGMFGSNGDTYGYPYAFRPVVSLKPDVELSGDSTNGWTIQ